MPPSLGSPPEVPVSDTEASQQSPEEEEELWGCSYSAAGCRERYTAGGDHVRGSVGTLQSVTSPYLLGDFKQAAASLDVVSKP